VPQVQAIRFDGSALFLLDQRLLPAQETWIRCTTSAEVADAIRQMVVRGAPAIGVAAAYGMALAVKGGEDRGLARTTLLESRPTAVNLRWALERLDEVAPERIEAEAVRIHEEDVAINRAIGAHGARLLHPGSNVYHHCNTGALATGGWGTALGIIRSAWAEGRIHQVWVGETRPYLQGARLTAWELLVEQIPNILVADGVAASLMAAGKVDAVLVGCDRVAANGDTANKIGTLGLAVLARHYDIPFFVAMPLSTWDPTCPSGDDIPIEERDSAEVRGHRGVTWAADVPVYNPSFDVTPHTLITAWVTERGVVRAPFADAVRSLDIPGNGL